MSTTSFLPLRLQALSLDNFESFARLLGGSEFGGCFCAVWRSFDKDWVSRCQDPDKPNLELTRRNVEQGHHIGYLVFDGDGLVGWTGSGPKVEFPLLRQKLASRLSPSEPGVWSLGCIAIKEQARGRGYSGRVASSVIELARQSGARRIESYPTRPWDEPRSYRGSWRMYQRLGFEVLGEEPDGESDILLMSLSL